MRQRVKNAVYRADQAVAELRVRRGRPSAASREPVVVSLTTYPARAGQVPRTIASIVQQDRPPERIVVVLSSVEFPGRRVPKGLNDIVGAHGVELLWIDEALRSYQKILPTLDAYPGATVVTADDDILYRRDWLARLLEEHHRRPDWILAHRATEIGLTDGRADPYVRWAHATTATPSRLVFPTGVGGVLYPPGVLPEQTLDTDLALRLCPTADDIWLKAMGLLADAPTAVVPGRRQEFHTAWGSQTSALATTNVAGGRNDEQFRAAMDHFGLWDRLAGRVEAHQ